MYNKVKHKLCKIYEVCSKSIKTKAVFTKAEMNNEWNINFLQNSLFVQRVFHLLKSTEIVLLKAMPLFFS